MPKSKTKSAKIFPVCVMIKSVTSRPGEDSVSVASWRPWLMDARALDALSPPWLRKGQDARPTELFDLAERFGEHCRGVMKAAAPEIKIDLRSDFSSEREAGLLVLALRVEAAEGDEKLQTHAAASAAIGEFRKLQGKSRSKLRPPIRFWKEAPEGTQSYWALDALGLESSGRRGLWAPELAAAVEAEQLATALPEGKAIKRASKSL